MWRMLPRVLFLSCLLLAQSAVSSAASYQLYVVDLVAQSGSGAVIQVDPQTGQQTLLSDQGHFAQLTAIAVEPTGSLLVADRGAEGTGAIIRVNRLTGIQTVLSTGGMLSRPSSIAVSASGQVYVTNGNGSSSSLPKTLLRIDPITGSQAIVSQNGIFNAPQQLAIDGGFAYVLDAASGSIPPRIIRVDLSTGTQSVVTTGGNLGGMRGIAADGSGSLFVVCANGPIVQVDISSGSQTSIGGIFRAPTDVEATRTGVLYITDTSLNPGCAPGFCSGGVIEFTSGATRDVSTQGNFVSPEGVAIVYDDLPTPSKGTSWGRLKLIYR